MGLEKEVPSVTETCFMIASRVSPNQRFVRRLARRGGVKRTPLVLVDDETRGALKVCLEKADFFRILLSPHSTREDIL